MQSFNKLPSFGDDTLSACIQAEVKNMDINNGSNMDVYFQDSTFPSKLTTKSNDIDKVSRSKQISHTSTNIKPNLNRNNSKHKESRINNISKSKLATKTSISNKLTIKKITSIRKNCDLLKINKENINTSANHIKTDTSNKNTLSKQCSKSELSSLLANNSSVKSNITTNNTTNVKLCNSSIAISNTEKSSESCSSISIIPTQDRYKLGSWGLPPNILQKYVARGITNMFAWQVECLSKHKVIEEVRNLVYSAPTSAGKTLVAEILMIKTVLERRKKVIFILPFVSVVREKMYYFQDLLSDSGVRVEGFTGGVVPPGGFAATHVAIATIEKANSLINRLMEENELVNLGAVVIDELHLVGDPNRGYLLELLLTKLKYMTFRNENINIQLIGMSATLPNISLLAKWLDAELYKTEFRPIPLNEQCKIGKNIYDSKLRLIRSLIPMPELSMDSDDIFHLCIETISDGHSVLIFCPTKNWCEKLAEQIAAAFYKLGQENTQLGKTLRDQLDSALISETLEQLKRSPIGLDNVLKNTVSFGVAFHHAGLTMDERDIIEGSFRSGSLRVLIATSTLSSGVNLPARRVIVRSPMFGGRLLDSLTYRQMIGRAGRMGKDTAGESILMCKPNEQKAAETLLSASLKPIHSCLEDSGPLIRALLEAIASEVVYTPSDLELYTKCTLVSLSEEHDSNDPANEAIKFLIDNEFLLLQKTEEGHRWVATAFGKACLAASIPPRDGLFLLEELQKARRCFVLDTELHVVYLVTPLNSGNQIGAIDWMTFLELWKLLSESERRVGQLVGVEERFLTSAIKGIVRSGKSLNIHRRFYTALALHDLVREVPLNAVCKKYGCCRGVLQTLQQSASTFAGMVTQFCKQLGWDCMELLVSQFQTRLQFGVCRELLDLLRLPMLNGLRARSLYKQGITSVADLAMANELDVERALYKALPFESEKEYDGEHESEAVKRNKMRTVFVTGKDGLTTHEAAIMLVHEARALVQNELRLQDMSWKQNEQSSVTNTSNSEISLQVQRSIHHNLTSQKNKINRKLQATHSICNETQTKKDITDKNIDSTSLNFSTLHAKHNSLSWKDDSWNEPKKITEKLNQIQDKNNEDVLVKCNIRNIKNTNVHLTETAEASNSTPKMRNKYDTNLEKPISTPDNLKKITRKRVFKDISVVKSPMANVILFSKTRATSLDSNKSDSDDIVIASQNVDSPATSIKIRNKLSYERKQRICTQKIPKQMSDDAKYTNIISKPIRDEEYKIKATLKKIFLQNVLTNKDCSTDSVISNSDEGTPIKTANILQKSKISLKRTQTSSRMCLQTNEFVGNMDEEVNWNTINIIKVGSDRPTFNLFKREVMQKRYIALALNCELYNNETNNIGTKIIGSINTERKKRTKRIENYVHADKKLCGVAISWENNIAYYISFSNEQDLKIPAKEQMKLLKDLLSNTLLYVQCFATKEIFKSLYECCGIIANCKFLDPKTASWLYDGNTYEKTFNEMVKEHFPQGCFITKRIGACYDIGPGLNIKSTVPGEFRASTETVLTWHITDSLLNKLEQLSPTLLYTFKEIEMKTVTLLACMELTGLGVSLKSLQDLSSAIRAEMTSLEERAYALSAKRFKFSSSKEVAEILGLYKKKKISINKAILGNSDHPISNLVMSWRKLNATQSKIVYPILNMAQHSSRIRGNCVTCTLTGRISMHEPNLQNVPRDFSSEDNSFTISVRMAFIPAIGNVILSADYCQLELRILAHFSKDATLCDIMRKPGDIFKSIAASWNHVSEDQVDDKMRQYTKQLCYGMIYGMGLKTLAESLSVDEVKAKEFLESFMNAYPSISKWLNNVLQDARTNGYVTTILDRRRMFPGLTSTIPAEKSQAERQAVNTTIQGSAADIAKKAMVNIEERIRFEFPTSAAIMSTVNSTRKLRSNSREAQQRGGYLILQLHDELLYEVNIKDLRQIATIVKESMEQVCQLAVPLTVKLKVGPAWGDLSEYNL
ncbi:DNA polymerase theta [Habropoda laboriosa]|uniref:DNA polymerase theta n=1 Tax=Habropoda laboriosa TaxID=597456 RepID=A0A0L7QWB8_9HYME|nr:DNA polymerase theta [Habropoda laboriosa]